jgi:hypothetical protein
LDGSLLPGDLRIAVVALEFVADDSIQMQATIFKKLPYYLVGGNDFFTQPLVTYHKCDTATWPDPFTQFPPHPKHVVEKVDHHIASASVFRGFAVLRVLLEEAG